MHPLVLLYLLTVVIPIGFNLGSVAMTSMRMLLMLTILPTTIGLFSGKYGKVYLVDYLFYAHIVWATIALLKNNPSLALQNSGSFSIEFLGGYALARAYVRTPGAFLALLRVITVLVAIAVPFAILETIDGRALIPDWIRNVPGLWSVVQTDIGKRMGLHRVQVYFAHPIHFGLFCSTALALTFVSMRGIVSDFARYMMTIAVFIGVFLSLSSGALLAALLQIYLVLWAYVLRKNEARWKILIYLFVFFYVAIDLGSNRTPLKVFMTYATFSTHNAYYRSIIFEWGMINVWANPIFGLGLRNWVRPHYMRTGSMDNFWLVMAVRYGIPGFLAIAGGYVAALYEVGRRKFVPASTVANMQFGWMVVFIGLSFTLMTVHIWTAIYSYVFFLIGAGMWMAGYTDQTGQGETVTEPADKRRRISYTRGLTAGHVHAREAKVSHSRADAAATAATAEEPEGKRSREAFTRYPERDVAGKARAFAREGEAIKHKR
ncbi:MAG: O-antigen ligase family protein [Albidovulum sp.]